MTNKLQQVEINKIFLSRIVKDNDPAGCWHLLSNDKTGFLMDFYFGKEKLKAKRHAYELLKKKIPTGLRVLSKCNNKLCINPGHQILGGGKELRQILYSRGWKPKKGWKQKPEIVEMLRKIHTGKVISQEMREHLRQLNLGNKHTKETRRKMSRSRIGIGVPKEAREKIAFTKQGEKNYNTRLTTKDVLEIRKLADSLTSSKIKTKGELTTANIANMFGISQIHVINIIKRKVWKHI